MEWYVRGSVHPNLWPPNFETGLPKRLGYNAQNRTAADSFGRTYIATHEFDRQFYTDAYFTPEQRAEIIVYDQADLARFDRDPTVRRIYDNGGFEAWYVVPEAAGPATSNATLPSS